ncbi:MAG: hypothetical protein ACRDMJ_17980 [Solirubrobacteraceae bacterium]
MLGLAFAGLLTVVLLSSRMGTATAAGPVTTTSPARFRAALSDRLHAQGLDFRWIACVPTSGRFEGVRVVRCNVDFGIDPHVEAYCSVLRGGRLVTSAQDPGIPCTDDGAGYSATIIRYG